MPKELTNKQRTILITKKTLFILLIGLKWIFSFALIGAFLVGGVVVGYVTSLVKDEPIRDKATIINMVNENALTGFVYFKDGTQVGQLRSDEDRRLANSIHEIPQQLQDAFIAVEDDSFMEHPGVDFFGTLRAARQKFLNEDQQTGGSTITQQLARRVFLSLEQTDSRKFKEIFLAMRMERMMTKNDILLAYLNKMPFGNGSNGYNVYGIKAAAKGIFDIEDLNQLHLAQSAYLGGLLKAPSDYSAFTSKGQVDEEGFQKAMERQHVVLGRMLAVGKIDQQQYDQALAFDMRSSLATPKEKAYTTYPYLMIEAERRAAEILLLQQNPEWTEQDLRDKKNGQLIKDAIEHMNRSGYQIFTTIDKTMYDALQEIAKNPENFTEDHPEKGIEQIGAMMLDNTTGEILAMMEGRSFYIEQLNHATQMIRQPGSAMKPIAAYIPALEAGLIQPGLPIDDVPLILKDGSKGAHVPDNHDNEFHGLLTARRALDQSYNIPALKLFLADYGGVGIDAAWDYAQKMGITTLTKQDYFAQTGVIGGLTEGVTVEELTNAYSTIPNKGVFKDAYMIDKIIDADGTPIYEHVEQPVTVYSEETAYLMTDMLRTVISQGTASLIKSRFKEYGKIPIYGKTGTTSNDYDVWFVGFSPNISLGVWTGYDQPSKLIRGKGTNRAKEIWAAIMNEATSKKPEWFTTDKIEKPANIVEMTVSSVSGKIPNELTKTANLLSRDLFNKKFLPTEEEDMLMNMQVIPYNDFNYIPQPTTPADFVVEKIVIKRQKAVSTIINELKAIFEQYPKVNSRNRPLEYYYTPDMSMDAPEETDPRIDGGLAPPVPANLKLVKEENNYMISYLPVTAEDVIGYRLYRSSGFGPFSRLEGTVNWTGQEPLFQVPAQSDSDAFYMTAVDIMGNESPPSTYLYANGTMVDPNLFPPSDGDGDTVPGSPSVPTNLEISARAGNVGIQMKWLRNPIEEGVKLYNIYYSDVADGEFRMIGYTENERFEYISFPSEGWYRVTAVNDNGESAPSAVVEMKTVE
jgi:penicillin-binding protein